MSLGITVLLCWLAVLGMLMAVGQSLLIIGDWGEYGNRRDESWVGKRLKDWIAPPWSSGPPSTGQILDRTQWILRRELGSLLEAMFGPGQWLCLCGILYLFAGHQLEARRRRIDDADAA